MDGKISFNVDADKRLRIATFEGIVTEPILFSSYQDLLSDPAYDPTLNDLADMRAVERMEVRRPAVLQLVAMFSSPDAIAATKLAIVAPSSHVFGMARMYEILSSDTPEQIVVFRDYDEAERWLGVSENL
jgi:hypothetical protein